MNKQRVVVTGLGMITNLGHDTAQTWAALQAGQRSVQAITHFDATAYPTRFAAMLRDFEVEQWLPAKEARRVDVFIQYALVAGQQALQDAGLLDGQALAAGIDPTQVGVAVGSGIGGLTNIEDGHLTLINSGPRKLSPFFVPGTVINMAAGSLAIRHGLQGPNIALTTACTTATHCIGLAARLIACGDAAVMLAGGSEKASTPLGMGGFSAARALSQRNDDPEAASRPFDRDRDGFVLGDGAGLLVLESLDHARARGANILAELIGFGMSDDAYHITAPPEDGRGATLAMRHALRDAGLNPEAIDYINAHGTSTPVGDLAETRAIQSVFGDHAARVMISSTKSMTGHLLGAAGGVEAIISVLALRDQVVPPTVNLDYPDPNCPLDYVPHTARQARLRCVLSNSFGFGGTNGSLIFRHMT